MIDPSDSNSTARRPLCREPWENYYILRRGIQPCCHGHKVIAPMSEWRTAWNGEALQEIRSYLARGELSPYCRASLSCPIVQRYLTEEELRALTIPNPAPPPPQPARPFLLRALNRLFLGLPARAYGHLTGHRP